MKEILCLKKKYLKHMNLGVPLKGSKRPNRPKVIFLLMITYFLEYLRPKWSPQLGAVLSLSIPGISRELRPLGVFLSYDCPAGRGCLDV